MSKIEWTFEEALELVRNLELAIAPHGYHAVMGGSVFHDGFSRNDLDIIIYPHKTFFLLSNEDLQQLLCEKLALEKITIANHERHDDCKRVGYAWTKDDRRIDFFFLT